MMCSIGRISTFHQPADLGETVTKATGPRRFSRTDRESEADADLPGTSLDSCGFRGRDGLPRLSHEPDCRPAESHAERMDCQSGCNLYRIWACPRVPGMDWRNRRGTHGTFAGADISAHKAQPSRTYHRAWNSGLYRPCADLLGEISRNGDPF